MNYVILDEFPNYEIYDGKIIRKEILSKTGKTLKRREIFPTKAKNGYRTVRLYNKDGVMKQFYLHRLIWMAFNGEIPEGYEIDHLEGDRIDNFLNRLRLVNHKINCNNPKSIERYKRANALDKGKFNRDKMIAAQGKRNYDRLVRTYKKLVKKYGHCGIWILMNEGHCGYPRAKRIVNEMGGKNDENP